jgi:hypothetical protein
MEDIVYFIYSHTDFSDLWIPTLTQFKEQTNNSKNIYFAVNNLSIFNEKIKNIYPEVIGVEYIDSLPFTNKLLAAINQISTKHTYVLLFFDFLILNKINNEYFNKIIQIMNYLSLDCFQLWNFNNEYNYLEYINDIYITSPGPEYNLYPLSVHPTIWKITSLIKLLNKLENVDYRHFEDYENQIYVHNNFKIRRFGRISNSIKTNTLNLSPIFTFFRITHYRKIYDNGFSSDNAELNNDYKQIFNRYNLSNIKIN